MDEAATFRAMLTDLISRGGHHGVGGRAAQVAFYSLLAMFPAALACLSLLSLLHVEELGSALQMFTRHGLPVGSAELILQQVEAIGTRSGWPLLLAIAATAYYAGQALGAMLSGVALAWNGEERRGMRWGLLGSGISGLLLLVSPLLLGLLTVATSLFGWAARAGLQLEGSAELVALLRWPILLVLFQQLVQGAYRLGAGKRRPSSWFSWGSAAASLGWMGITQGFEWYLERFANLGATYGSLAAAIGLLLYLHAIASLILYGAELDAVRGARLQSPTAPAAPTTSADEAPTTL